MTELIKRGHVYIAQPPLFKIKKGRSEQYIKNERDYFKVMVKRASEGIVVKYDNGTKSLTDADLNKFMNQLHEYLDLFEKVNKRLRNEKVTETFADVFAHEGKEPVKRSDFESAATLESLKERLKALQVTEQLKAVNDPVLDEEHQTWSLSFTDSQGATRYINWTFASSPETRQLLAKHAQLRDRLRPPFVVEYSGKASQQAPDPEETEGETIGEIEAGKPASKRIGRASHEPVVKETPRDLFDYVIEQGRRDFQVQRYKGLGEMTAPQLWETTMDPERRTLLSVRLEDLTETETIFTTLMGEDVDARRKFIEENALDVKNLDI
jgi:DNA gyrase subunit B